METVKIKKIIDHQTRLNLDLIKNLYRLRVDSKVIGDGRGFGTGFTVFRGKKIYLISAAHLFSGIHIDDIADSLSIQYRKKFEKVQIKDFIIGDCDNVEEDIAVFNVAANSLCQKFDYDNLPIIEPFRDTVYIGQQIIFAGYPFINNQMRYLEDADTVVHKGFPRPFLKYGYLSHFTQNPPRFYIDGAPNKGFSGGPIMYRDESNSLRYLGVVSRGANDAGLGGFTMICGTMDTVEKYIDEVERRISK